MIRVQVYASRCGVDAVVGTITWDGLRMAAEPADSPKLQRILERPVRELHTGRVIDAAADHEAFLRNLKYNYRGPSLRAGAAEEV